MSEASLRWMKHHSALNPDGKIMLGKVSYLQSALFFMIALFIHEH